MIPSRRAARYRDAGANGVFVPGPSDESLIGRLAEAIDLPLNVMGYPGVPAASRLQAVGVRRLSSATGPFRAAYAAMAGAAGAFLADGDAAAFKTPGGALPDFDQRFG